MKIIEPNAEVWFHYPMQATDEFCGDQRIVIQKGELNLEKFLEQAGRLCYKSEDKITSDSARKFISMLYERGHHAMLEHCFASVKFITDRGVTHELVRHRLVSYAQESTRYCNYGKDKFGGEISVIKPPGLDAALTIQWERACEEAERAYLTMIKNYCSPQIARSVLPTCLKTEIWASTNLREWTHIFKLRCAKTAHPQIREVMFKALEIFKDEVPSMFLDLWEKYRDLEISKLKEKPDERKDK